MVVEQLALHNHLQTIKNCSLHRNEVVEEEVDLLSTFDVMIVDDVNLNRRILKRMICNSVRSVCEYVDGIDVVEAMYPPDSSDAVAPPIDIISLDLVMPRMNGMDATMKLRELGFSKPIVAVTANATLQDRRKCIAAGMDDVLPKPFSKKQILDILGRCCTAGADASSCKSQIASLNQSLHKAGHTYTSTVTISKVTVLVCYMTWYCRGQSHVSDSETVK
jgi:CheY-like chemotaxis protein